MKRNLARACGLLIGLIACCLPWPVNAQLAGTAVVEVAATPGVQSPAPKRNLSLAEQARLAEQAYTEGHYEEAVRCYEALAEQAPYDPRVLYNLATAYARAGQRGLAIWRYLQAQRLDPRNADIGHNLEVLGYERASMLPFPLDQLHSRFSGNEWAFAAGASTLVCLVLLTVMFRQARGGVRRQLLRQAALWTGTMAFVIWPFAIGHFYQDQYALQGVIVTDNTVMRTGPSTSQITTYGLNSGSVVRIRERRQDGWLKISFGTGYVGYVEQDAVRCL